MLIVDNSLKLICKDICTYVDMEKEIFCSNFEKNQLLVVENVNKDLIIYITEDGLKLLKEDSNFSNDMEKIERIVDELLKYDGLKSAILGMKEYREKDSEKSFLKLISLFDLEKMVPIHSFFQYPLLTTFTKGSKIFSYFNEGGKLTPALMVWDVDNFPVGQIVKVKSKNLIKKKSLSQTLGVGVVSELMSIIWGGSKVPITRYSSIHRLVKAEKELEEEILALSDDFIEVFITNFKILGESTLSTPYNTLSYFITLENYFKKSEFLRSLLLAGITELIIDLESFNEFDRCAISNQWLTFYRKKLPQAASSMEISAEIKQKLGYNSISISQRFI